ncbi:RNA polymerase sigma-70 factor, ECF subfamily [Allokutzneria albata]|uniref:RNA polymerase sigma-70 factor, ECF subfamily n=1 Tax=Allokutzneria albata TaxID=211114 RepID=A0A1G9S5F4_ALLAB|nr:RNA polymerase sigma-70 factor, ECF subfamily [Allokutzneria albata]
MATIIAVIAQWHARRVDFDALVAEHRRELYAHCYRMLGSAQDAEDAMQEALLGAWRGLARFEGRSSVRAWLYRICTNACLRFAERRPRRVSSVDFGPARVDVHELGEPVPGPVWLEPLAPETDPAERYLLRESVELAFVAAVQLLPGTQRAVLLLREVLGFSAAEVASILDTTPASVNSALQRARATVRARVGTSQGEELDALGEQGRRELVDAFLTAWERADTPALLDLLAEDAKFTMPPLPAWFDGKDNVARFLRERVFATPWRLVPLEVNAQPGFACYLRRAGDTGFRFAAIAALTLRAGRVAEINSFLDPDLRSRFGLPEEFRADR